MILCLVPRLRFVVDLGAAGLLFRLRFGIGDALSGGLSLLLGVSELFHKLIDHVFDSLEILSRLPGVLSFCVAQPLYKIVIHSIDYFLS